MRSLFGLSLALLAAHGAAVAQDDVGRRWPVGTITPSPQGGAVIIHVFKVL